jgi:hypothetical protein
LASALETNRVIKGIESSDFADFRGLFFNTSIPLLFNLRNLRINLWDTRTHLKNRILVQDRGGAEFQTGGILLYVEDLKRGTNKDIEPKDIFEMGSKYRS